MPALRQMSATGMPSAPCFRMNAFWASENLMHFTADRYVVNVVRDCGKSSYRCLFADARSTISQSDSWNKNFRGRARNRGTFSRHHDAIDGVALSLKAAKQSPQGGNESIARSR